MHISGAVHALPENNTWAEVVLSVLGRTNVATGGVMFACQDCKDVSIWADVNSKVSYIAYSCLPMPDKSHDGLLSFQSKTFNPLLSV